MYSNFLPEFIIRSSFLYRELSIVSQTVAGECYRHKGRSKKLSFSFLSAHVIGLRIIPTYYIRVYLYIY